MRISALPFILLFYFSCSTDENIELSNQETVTVGTPAETTLASSLSHTDKQFSSQWSITREILKGGKQEGVELLTLDDGRLKIRIIPTRGMGILDVKMDGIRLGWDSPVKEVVHPSPEDAGTPDAAVTAEGRATEEQAAEASPRRPSDPQDAASDIDWGLGASQWSTQR